MTGARVRVIGSDPRRAHGLAPVLVLADEPAQWPSSTGEKMVAALRTAAGKQPHSRFVALGTRPADAEHWFSKLLVGGCDYAQCHAGAGERSPVSAADLGEGESLPRAYAGSGVGDPHRGAASPPGPGLACQFRGVAAQSRHRGRGGFNAAGRGLVASDRRRCRAGRADGLGCRFGNECGTARGGLLSPSDGRAGVPGGLPCGADPCAERGLRDGVGGLYAECARRGDLLTLGRHTVDVTALLQAALDRFGRPARIVADRWREADLREALESAGVPLAALEFRGMGFRDGAGGHCHVNSVAFGTAGALASLDVQDILPSSPLSTGHHPACRLAAIAVSR